MPDQVLYAGIRMYSVFGDMYGPRLRVKDKFALMVVEIADMYLTCLWERYYSLALMDISTFSPQHVIAIYVAVSPSGF